MTYTFKLSRRLANIRALAALALALGACADSSTLAPDDTSNPAPTTPVTDLSPGSAFAGLPPGKGLGMPNWPRERWGSPPMTVAHETASPREVAARLHLARQEMMPLVLGPRRRDLTHNGEAKGRFSLTNAKRSVDAYASGPLTPDTVAKYHALGLLRAWYSIDEPFCAHCWDGVAANYSDVLAYLKYFREKIDPQGLVPMAIRVSPSKLDDYGDWDGVLDVAWVVWKPGSRFTATELLDREYDIAKVFGWKLIAGMNAEDCTGSGSVSCTGTQLRTGLESILKHAGVCASLTWQWTDATWKDSGVRAAWDDLSALARSLPTVTCGTPLTSGGGTPTTGSLARIDLKTDRVACVVGDRVQLTATAYDAAGNTLAMRLKFRVPDDGVLGVSQTGDRTATLACKRRGTAKVVAYKSGVRDRSAVAVR